jgi:hypothetical protein
LGPMLSTINFTAPRTITRILARGFIIIIVISGSTDLVRPWPPHTGGFVIYFRHLVGLL